MLALSELISTSRRATAALGVAKATVAEGIGADWCAAIRNLAGTDQLLSFFAFLHFEILKLHHLRLIDMVIPCAAFYSIGSIRGRSFQHVLIDNHGATAHQS